MKQMSAKEFSALLRKLGACPEARQWAKGKSLLEVWDTCENPSWMLWLAEHTDWWTHKQLVACAVGCAELAIPFAGVNADVCQATIAVVREWLAGKATLEQVAAAGAAAWAATLKQCADIVRRELPLPEAAHE